jgi:addiction module RelE/StbE family toxin
MKIYWAAVAEQDRAEILEFIAQDNPRAAIAMDERFVAAVARLADHPLMGRTGLVPGTRELIPHESYRLVYEVEGDTVWILALVHTARMWPQR